MESILLFLGDNFWLTATIIATMTTTLTGVINSRIKPNGVWKQVVSWVVSIALTVGCYFLNLITVSNPVWLTLALTGFVVGLASNGIYDLPAMRKWITSWISNLPAISEKKEY